MWAAEFFTDRSLLTTFTFDKTHKNGAHQLGFAKPGKFLYVD